MTIIVVAYVVNTLYEIFGPGPTTEVKESKLCKGGHSWKSVILITSDNLKEFKGGDDKFLDNTQHYCHACGYLPSKNKMLKPEILAETNLQNEAIEKNAQRIQDIETLKKECLDNYIKHRGLMSVEEREGIEFGFDLYDSFIQNLPNLLKNRELERIVNKLKLSS